jgi:hypothetical protein
MINNIIDFLTVSVLFYFLFKQHYMTFDIKALKESAQVSAKSIVSMYSSLTSDQKTVADKIFINDSAPNVDEFAPIFMEGENGFIGSIALKKETLDILNDKNHAFVLKPKMSEDGKDIAYVLAVKQAHEGQ